VHVCSGTGCDAPFILASRSVPTHEVPGCRRGSYCPETWFSRAAPGMPATDGVRVENKNRFNLFFTMCSNFKDWLFFHKSDMTPPLDIIPLFW